MFNARYIPNLIRQAHPLAPLAGDEWDWVLNCGALGPSRTEPVLFNQEAAPVPAVTRRPPPEQPAETPQ